MRTTVNIDDELLEQARARAHATGQTLGDVVDESLRELFTSQRVRSRPELPVFSGGGGFVPGIDPTSNASIYDAMDGEVSPDGALRE